MREKYTHKEILWCHEHYGKNRALWPSRVALDEMKKRALEVKEMVDRFFPGSSLVSIKPHHGNKAGLHSGI